MANRITEEQIRIINEEYLRCHTYSGAAKAAGCSPSTAKKYIIPNFSACALSTKEYDIEPMPIESIAVFTTTSQILTELTIEEEEELKDFWKEIKI